jgi:hypothetical protein
VWDLRNAKKPINTAYNLDIVNPEANVIFSPDEKLILTGNLTDKQSEAIVLISLVYFRYRMSKR